MTIPILRRTATVAVAVLALAGVAAVPATAGPTGPPTTTVRLIGLNDFHGNLEPPAGSSGRVVLSNGSTVTAGGAAYLATYVRQLRTEQPNSLVLSGGDNIGASPLASALFHDEPTIEFLDSIGTTASAVGNHELDEGYAELNRIEDGGCHPVDGCQFRNPYPGAEFPFLASNITFTSSGQPATQPYTVRSVAGVPIGIIGATLKDLPTIVEAAGIKGLAFGDEATAINKASAELQALGVKAQVVVIHQGDSTVGANGPNDCNLVAGPLSAINSQVSTNVDAIISGHSHTQYNCQLPDPAGNPRTVIQSLSFGRLLSVVDLSINLKSQDVMRERSKAENIVVTRTVPADPAVQAIVDEAVTRSAPIANRQVGSITATIVRAATPSGESPLGNLIADSQLAATTTAAGAQIALMNPGGVRSDLTYASSPVGEGDGVVTYGEAFTVQPFGNILQTLTYTGAQIDAVLEQQWLPNGPTRILQPSATLHYTQTLSAPIGDRVSNITINGVPVEEAASYRVTVNNFLAGGGDSFTVLTQGTNVTGGPIDLDAFTAYLAANSPVAPPGPAGSSPRPGSARRPPAGRPAAIG